MAAPAAAMQPHMAVSGVSGLEKLTRRHAIKLSPAAGVSVEECSLAVGAVVGYGSVKSASRMNHAVVIFLDCTYKVNQLVESGVVIQGTLTPVLPLVNPTKKVIISNVPPFLKNEMLEKELARHGQLMSPITMIPLRTLNTSCLLEDRCSWSSKGITLT